MTARERTLTTEERVAEIRAWRRVDTHCPQAVGDMLDAYDAATNPVRRLAEVLCERGLVHLQLGGCGWDAAVEDMVRTLVAQPPSKHRDHFGTVIQRVFGREPSTAEWIELDIEMLAYARQQQRFRAPETAVLG